MNISNSTSSNLLNEPYTIVLGTFLFSLTIVTTAGNVIVLLAILRAKHLMSTISKIFISSLACADLLTGVIVMPLTVFLTISGIWNFGQIMCDIYNSISMVSAIASLETLCFIAIDRYIAITAPLRYLALVTPRRALVLTILGWIVSGVLALQAIWTTWWNSDHPLAQACYEDPTCCDFITSKSFAVVSVTIAFYIPLGVMVIVYSRVLKEAELQVRNNNNVFACGFVTHSSVFKEL